MQDVYLSVVGRRVDEVRTRCLEHSRVETGKRNPRYGSLRRLADGLGLSASELLARAEQVEASGVRAPNTSAVARR